jgi:hypothetical protein
MKSTAESDLASIIGSEYNHPTCTTNRYHLRGRARPTGARQLGDSANEGHELACGSDRAWRVLTFGPDQLVGRPKLARGTPRPSAPAWMENKVQYVLGWADRPRIADID